MLGEKIQDLDGRVTSVRVVPNPNGGAPKVEISFQATGTILGQAMTEIGSYVATPQADGTMFGEGNGVVNTPGGDLVHWTGNGRGTPTGKGMGASWRGAIYFSTTSSKLARLNGLATVFEWETQEDGSAKGTVWEWK